MTPVLFGENDNNLKVTHFATGDPSLENVATLLYVFQFLILD